MPCAAHGADTRNCTTWCPLITVPPKPAPDPEPGAAPGHTIDPEPAPDEPAPDEPPAWVAHGRGPLTCGR